MTTHLGFPITISPQISSWGQRLTVEAALLPVMKMYQVLHETCASLPNCSDYTSCVPFRDILALAGSDYYFDGNEREFLLRLCNLLATNGIHSQVATDCSSINLYLPSQ